MDTRFLIILSTFALFMILVNYYHRHHNDKPIEQGDVLVNAIQEHNAKGSRLHGLTDLMGKGPTPPEKIGPSGDSLEPPAPLPPLATVAPNAMPQQNGFYPPPANDNSGVAAPPVQNPGYNAQPSYYPPSNQAAPVYTQPVPGPQTNRAPPGAFKQPSMPGGPKIEFSGDNVYTFDATGHKMVMPDGNYPIYGGQIIMTVRDGKKVTANN